MAARLGVACVSNDSLWHALQSVTTRESHPAFHYFEPTEEEWRRGPEYLCERHINGSEAMTPAIEAFLDRELKEGHNLLFEGAWMTPEMAARRMKADCAAVAFIHEDEETEVLAAMVRRQGFESPSERQLKLAPMAWRYGNWLKEGAERLGLPLVAARPRDTLVERIIGAIA